jgi:alkylation response protein AidB-like acyl-CoA dehydrogenase
VTFETVLPVVELPPEDEALRAPVRAFLERTIAGRPADVRARSWLGFDAAFSRALGEQGWLGLGLPKEYGGQDRGPLSRFVVVEELLSAGAPVAAHWIADRQSGPLILHYGTAAQRAFYLPRICRGEAFFCIGMSEPNAGSDLASVRTQATRLADGKGWQLDGQKIWTTAADKAHFMIALVRTSGTSADRHAGLSQMIIDLSLPGITVKPIVDVTGDAHFCEVHFDKVQLADDALVGEEGAGWEQVNAELAFERSGPERFYSNIVLFDLWVELLRQSASATAADAATATLIGRFTSELAVLRALSIAVAAKLAAGERPMLEASLVKDMGTEFEQRIPQLLGDAIALAPDEALDPTLRRTLLYATQISPSYSLRGGTREILRGIIARGLGLR